jgi:EmrB/QacA subfamily drug resistance transporter
VILAVCCSALFLVGLDNTIVNVGLPAIARSLHADVAGLQWTIAGYTVVLASMLMFSGAVADRIGRRTIFQAGLALFTLGSLLCSLAPDLGTLIAFRVLQGVGGSMLAPPALGIITNVFPGPAERARVIGVWDGVLGLSMALGPLAGGILVGTVGWPGIFWVNVPVGLAAIVATALLVPGSKAASGRRFDPVGQILVVTMLGALTYGIIQGPGDGWWSPFVIGFFAISLGAFVLLLEYESHLRQPLIDFRLFRSVPFSASAATAVCAIAASGGFLFLTTLYLQDARGFSPLEAGLTLLPMPVMMAATSPMAGRMLARSGPRLPFVIAGTALTLSTFALTRLSSDSGLLFLLAAYALFGVGAGMVNSPITNGFISGVPKSQAGVASGMNSSARQLGQSLGVAIAGSVLAASLHGGIAEGFPAAARAAWWVLVGCGCAVLFLGVVSTTRWARSTVPETGADA